MTLERPKKLLNKNFLLLIIISLVTSLGYSMISTLVSSYAVSFGAQLAAAGLIAGIFSISALVCRPFGGFITDLLNKKWLCILTTIFISLLMASYALCANIWPLLLVRIFHGAVFGLNSTVNMALAAEYIPEDKMGQGLGYYGLGQVLSQIIGPSIGVEIKDLFGYRTLFILVSMITFLAAAMMILSFSYHNNAGKKSGKVSAPRFSLNQLIAKECIVYALIAGLFSMSNGIVNSFLVLLGEERGIAKISLFFSVNAIMLFVLRLAAGRVTDRLSLLPVVNLSLLTGAIAMVLIGRIPVLPMILLAAAIKAFGNIGGQISLQSACVKKVDAARIGVATSTYFIGADIGQGFGPIWGGKIAEAFGYSAVFYCMAAFFLAGMAAFTIFQSRKTTRLQRTRKAWPLRWK